MITKQFKIDLSDLSDDDKSEFRLLVAKDSYHTSAGSQFFNRGKNSPPVQLMTIKDYWSSNTEVVNAHQLLGFVNSINLDDNTMVVNMNLTYASERIFSDSYTGTFKLKPIISSTKHSSSVITKFVLIVKLEDIC